jgi:hypothetical protein
LQGGWEKENKKDMKLEDDLRLVAGYVVSLADTLADLNNRITSAKPGEEQCELADHKKRVRDQLAFMIAELGRLDKGGTPLHFLAGQAGGLLFQNLEKLG